MDNSLPEKNAPDNRTGRKKPEGVTEENFFRCEIAFEALFQMIGATDTGERQQALYIKERLAQLLGIHNSKHNLQTNSSAALRRFSYTQNRRIHGAKTTITVEATIES